MKEILSWKLLYNRIKNCYLLQSIYSYVKDMLSKGSGRMASNTYALLMTTK